MSVALKKKIVKSFSIALPVETYSIEVCTRTYELFKKKVQELTKVRSVRKYPTFCIILVG